MKMLMAIFLSAIAFNTHADERWAHEYSSDNDRNWRKQRAIEIYQQQKQTPIQIYIAPNSQRFYSEEHENYDDRYWRNRQRDDRYWRQRREELQQKPQTPYFENQFDRDDTHW